jgi:NADH-quinone oxidoreductase subunit E
VKTKNSDLPETSPHDNLSKSESLLRGIEILSEYHSIGLDDMTAKARLRSLLAESTRLTPLTKKGENYRQLAQELRHVDEIIDKHGRDKGALIQILLDINAENHWLPKTSLLWVSERLEIPLSQIYHIASFYKVFSLVPQGRHIIQVCLGTACQVRNAPRLLDRVLTALKISSPGTDKEQKFTLTTVNCLGCCALGPVMVIDENHYSNPSSEQLTQILANYN